MQAAQLALAMPINCVNLPAAMFLFIVSLLVRGRRTPVYRELSRKITSRNHATGALPYRIDVRAICVPD
jgi:hypothetical protein